MPRNTFKGAPETSRLFDEAPVGLFREFLVSSDFAMVLKNGFPNQATENDEDVKNTCGAMISDLRSDGLRLIEAEARRITALSEPGRDAMLRRLAESPRFGAVPELLQQRDALARSLWSYVQSQALFIATERAIQVRAFREHARLYEGWPIDATIGIEAAEIDEDALAAEIATRLHHDEGCRVEAVDLPDEDGQARDVLLAVTFFGAFASQRTVEPDKTTKTLYFRPPDELLLVYSSDRRTIEVCARDASERRIVANVFAETALGHDVINKPLNQKSFDLSRFRHSLKLDIPEEEAHRVRRAVVSEVQVALGDWSRKVSLSVALEDDIDAIARAVFGAILPKSRGGYITRIAFHIEYSRGTGRAGVLKFTVFGRNKSDIQNERDPAKRALGYDLLEAWGVMHRIGDLPLAERTEKLPELLSLYDLPSVTVTGRALEEMNVAAAPLARAGFLLRKGWSDVILFDDEELGEVLHDVTLADGDAQALLSLSEGGPGPTIDVDEILEYEIRFDYIRDALRDVLKPIGLRGRTRELSECIHQVGTATMGLADVPVYLGRNFSDDKVLSSAEKLVRGESALIRGIVFVPGIPRFTWLGSHIVLNIEDYVDAVTGLLDQQSVRVAYEACVDGASRGNAVHFRKVSDKAGQISVPGQEPRIVTGAKKVKLFERLFQAHQAREFGVKLAHLKVYADFSQLPQLFGEEWSEFENRYIYRCRHGYWALCAEPISV